MSQKQEESSSANARMNRSLSRHRRFRRCQKTTLTRPFRRRKILTGRSIEKLMLTKKTRRQRQSTESFCKRFNQSKCVRVIIAAGLIILLVGGSVFAVIRSRNTGTEDTLPTTAVVTYWRYWHLYRGSGETAARNTEELGLGIEGKISQVLVPREMRCMP